MPMNTSTHHHARVVCNDEICPLCLSRYAVAVEQICISCEAPSCPACVEQVEGGDDALCFACHGPTQH